MCDFFLISDDGSTDKLLQKNSKLSVILKPFDNRKSLLLKRLMSAGTPRLQHANAHLRQKRSTVKHHGIIAFKKEERRVYFPRVMHLDSADDFYYDDDDHDYDHDNDYDYYYDYAHDYEGKDNHYTVVDLRKTKLASPRRTGPDTHHRSRASHGGRQSRTFGRYDRHSGAPLHREEQKRRQRLRDRPSEERGISQHGRYDAPDYSGDTYEHDRRYRSRNTRYRRRPGHMASSHKPHISDSVGYRPLGNVDNRLSNKVDYHLPDSLEYRPSDRPADGYRPSDSVEYFSDYDEDFSAGTGDRAPDYRFNSAEHRPLRRGKYRRNSSTRRATERGKYGSNSELHFPDHRRGDVPARNHRAEQIPRNEVSKPKSNTNNVKVDLSYVCQTSSKAKGKQQSGYKRHDSRQPRSLYSVKEYDLAYQNLHRLPYRDGQDYLHGETPLRPQYSANLLDYRPTPSHRGHHIMKRYVEGRGGSSQGRSKDEDPQYNKSEESAKTNGNVNNVDVSLSYECNTDTEETDDDTDRSYRRPMSGP